MWNLNGKNWYSEEEYNELKKQIRLYDCIQKWGTKECHCAYRYLGNEFCEDAENRINELKEDLTALQHTYKAAENEYNAVVKQNKDLQLALKELKAFLVIEQQANNAIKKMNRIKPPFCNTAEITNPNSNKKSDGALPAFGKGE